MAEKHFVLTMDAWVQPPAWNFDHDVEVTPNATAPRAESLAKATMIMTSGTPVTEEIINAAPKLQLVNANGTGTDHIARAALKKRGIKLSHVPAQNTASVSEHAFALYYALRRRIMPMHELTMDGTTWAEQRTVQKSFGPPTRTNHEETLCIIGYGALGKNIEKIGTALGMHVIVAERKGATEARPGRVLFDEALKHGTVFIVVAPLDDSTRGMIGTTELSVMDNTSFVINVGRGGIVNEKALVDALREHKIAGAACDVFEHEPATKANSPLLDPTIPNLIVTPHIAWYSTATIKGTLATIKTNLEAFAAGKPQNLVSL